MALILVAKDIQGISHRYWRPILLRTLVGLCETLDPSHGLLPIPLRCLEEASNHLQQVGTQGVRIDGIVFHFLTLNSNIAIFGQDEDWTER